MSLYIQITTRCNMQCPHCCFSCGRNGENMSREHMIAALTLLRQAESNGLSVYPTIGGGEPTLHPDCMQFVKWVAEACEEHSYSAGMPVVGIVTNGSREKQALELARMAKRGEISARLSYDAYHDLSKVSQKVYRAFQAKYDDDYADNYDENDETTWPEPAAENDGRAINQYQYFITPHGRAKRTGMANHPFIKEDSCCCDGLFITPDGTIWQCGCRKVKMGHLNDLEAFWKMYHANVNEDGDVSCSKKHKLQQPVEDFCLVSD